IQVRENAPIGSDPQNINHRAHEKHFIVDGEVAVEGSMNLADAYMFGGTNRKYKDPATGEMKVFWRDIDIEIEGPAVDDVTDTFISNWALNGPVFDPALVKKYSGKVKVVGNKGDINVCVVRQPTEKDNFGSNLYVA